MKATKIIAKHKSTCPGCAQNIFPGSSTKVYNDKWFHTSCWDELWTKIAEEKDNKKAKKLIKKREDTIEDTYINMEIKQEEIAVELRGLVLKMEVLTGRIRTISREMGASW
jgi:hypothetical protein